MKVVIDNTFKSLRMCLNVLRWSGILIPERLTGTRKLLMQLYACSLYLVVEGVYIIIQMGDLFQVWGDISLMTGASFLLLTNLTYSVKLYNVMTKRDVIQALVDEGDRVLTSEERTEGRDIIKRYIYNGSCDEQTTRLMSVYLCCTVVSVSGWVVSTEKGSLHFRAWYPYDTTKSPAYELTYLHQSVGLVILAGVHVCLDVLVTSLTAVCRCRLRLLALSLRTICRDISLTDKNLVSPEHEKTVLERLRTSAVDHQVVLESAATIKSCFSGTILTQFTVSMIIICVSAYQLAVETPESKIRLIAVSTYLLDMIIQVFIYCYEGHHLKEESEDVANAVYECSWYTCSIPVKRALLIIMARSRHACILTAGGFTTLSLDCFVSIIKASYSFFTVLKQMEE